MLEIKDVKITAKDNFVYLNYLGVDYICTTDNFYAAIRVFLAGKCVEPFDTYLIKRAGERR